MQNSGILPDALYRPIIEAIAEEHTLYQLTLASQVLRLEAERVLYHTMIKDDLYTHKRFLNAVVNDSRLASYVRRYSLMASRTIDEELWDLLALGLQAMTNLLFLGFRDHGGTPSASKILPKCTFQLKSLEWGCHQDEDYLVEFFAAQPRISKLSLDSSWGEHINWEVPPTYLPDLEQLHGGHGAVKLLLPNRKVTRVRWIPDLDEPLRPDPVFLSELNQNVKTLSFGGYFARMELPLIASHLQNLEFLELIGLLVRLFALSVNNTVRMVLLSSTTTARSLHQTYSTRSLFSTSCRRLDHYKTLGIPQNASKAQIKSHFYQLSKKHHPDVATDPNSKAVYLAVSEAYTVLSNDRSKRAYDRSLLQDAADTSSSNYHPHAPPSKTRRANYAWEHSSRPRPHPQSPRHNPFEGQKNPHANTNPSGQPHRPGQGRHYQGSSPFLTYHTLDPFYRNPQARRAEEAEREMDRVRNESGVIRALQVFGVVAIGISIFGTLGRT
ncbi:DnaJ-domain-containing protein [Pluteus cervinus]|uniref:DnaJ-domain-containing protein n=1 Tax=Pluteus cervinus TaxID=181527 RepID=A0ACD3BD14_9AGAR|nr:DnaJ-domain-containing protein [Pluteus cervinus]